MKNVPEHARVSKPEYKVIRKKMETYCNIYGFEFHDAWDLMIKMVEERHARVVAGAAKFEMTLEMAVENMYKQLSQERGRQDALAKVNAILGEDD